MVESEVIALVRAEMGKAGSMREYARRIGVSAAYMSDLLSGRRAPGPKILDQFGLERVKTIEYLPKKGARLRPIRRDDIRKEGNT